MTTSAETELQYKERIERERREQEQEMKNPETSPLDDSQLVSFKGLEFFPINLKYKIIARLTYAGQQKEELQLTDGSKKEFIKFGTARFSFEDAEYSFDIFQSSGLPDSNLKSGQLFIPFCDGTTGRETSDDGRYICVRTETGSDSVELDFNQACNFFHAYNSQYACVVVPERNRPKHDFSVGQRKFEDR